MKIFITGGHFTPAKAVIDELLLRGGWEIFFVGRKNSMEDDPALALEFQELKDLEGVKFLNLRTGRLQRRFFVHTAQSIKALLKVFVGFFQALYWLVVFRPKIILSFGGYLALPVVICGSILRIPSITHEQTTVSGIANKIISGVAIKVLVSWPDSLNKFPNGKAVLTGNPIRKEILEIAGKKKINSKIATIFVTGGNQGAHAINEMVGKVLPRLLTSFSVIHQTGDSRFGDYEALKKLAENLPMKLQKKYTLKKFLSASQLALVLAETDLAVSRSGANYVSEFLRLQIPAVYIPIPWSGGGEQKLNAEMVQKLGGAEIIVQEDLDEERLMGTVERMQKSYETYVQNLARAKDLIRHDAASRIVDELEKTI